LVTILFRCWVDEWSLSLIAQQQPEAFIFGDLCVALAPAVLGSETILWTAGIKRRIAQANRSGLIKWGFELG
jgi:hypothetical protein